MAAFELSYRDGGRSFPRANDRRSIIEGVDMLRQILEKAGSEGKWTARLGQHTRLVGEHRFRVKRVHEYNRSFTAVCKPSGNDSVWEFDVTGPPAMDIVDFEMLVDRLSHVDVRKRGEHNREAAVFPKISETKAAVLQEVKPVLPTPEPFNRNNGKPTEAAPPANTVENSSSVTNATTNGAAVPAFNVGDMTAWMGKMGAITQRVGQRESHLTKLRDRLHAEEDMCLQQMLKLEQMQDAVKQTQDLIKQLEAEDAADAEAAAAKQFMALCKTAFGGGS